MSTTLLESSDQTSKMSVADEVNFFDELCGLSSLNRLEVYDIFLLSVLLTEQIMLFSF